VLALLALLSLILHGPPARGAGKLVSVYPFGGQRGTALDVEIRGTDLAGSHTVWFGPDTRMVAGKSLPASQAKMTRNSDGLEAHVQAVRDGSRVKVHLDIRPDVRAGFHTLSLISPSGLSGAISFWVGPHAVIQEADAPHNTPDTAQPVKVPVAINGRISESGELDYYAFEITREQAVAFEVLALHGPEFDPQLALYEAGGSFLDPNRSKRLVFHEEVTQGSMPASRRMTYHFTR